MNIAGVTFESFVDAVGVAAVIFVSGCKHYCPCCHSQKTHDFEYGKPFNDKMIDYINSEIDKRPFLNALVLSGGDPMYSAKEILKILPRLHIPNDNLWCYSGFTLEEIQSNPDMEELLEHCNHLVDGMFDYKKRDITLSFRGSSNQIIWKKENGVWIVDKELMNRC